MEYLKIHNQIIPQLGFGTAGIGNNKKTHSVITQALDIGYRRFDTASMYNNESTIGQAIQDYHINRTDVFVTTKLWDGGNFSYENTIKEVEGSCKRLNLGAIDLYLQHWPVSNHRLESWSAMEELVDEGQIRYLGVSNYTIKHLQELQDHASIQPVLNQVEFNPFLFQKDLLQYCQRQGIILEAYSPLVQGKKLNHPTLLEISDSHNKSSAQVILRWAIQLGISVIPKATSTNHITQNFDIFDFHLTDGEMDQISALNEDLRLEWDPTDVL